MANELRCDNGILFGILDGEQVIEFKCRSRRCGARLGVVVIHYFSVVDGLLVKTDLFKDPATTNKKEVQNGG
jgi:hypothetical protein